MTKVHTISFVIEGNIVSIEIFVADIKNGVWNIDNNVVVLSTLLYAQFRNCRNQNEQRKFFDALHKVSQYQLTA